MSARSLLPALVAAAALAAPPRAAACGAFYGSSVEVSPDQEIVLVHRGGTETYVFRPRFCGVAADFGVILPVPAALSASPALADAALFDDVERFTTPTRVEVCAPSGSGCGGAAPGAPGGDQPEFGTGVDVVDQGRVGFLDWSLVQATSVEAFTGWLTANGYPYDPGLTAAYQAYVDQGWYFVAFKVTGDASALEPGQRLCGDLGPIQLGFPSAAPVVPARITAVNAEAGVVPRWRVFVVSADQQRLADPASFLGTLYFSGALDRAAMADYPALTAVSADGERLTAVDVLFPTAGAATDIVLAPEASPFAWRSELQVAKDCSGCGAAGSPTLVAGLLAALGLRRALRRRG